MSIILLTEGVHLNEFLIGIMYHEPESWKLWNKGIIEDYESTSGVYISAENVESAIAWGEEIGQKVLDLLNKDELLNWKELGYYAWHIEIPSESDWSHCLNVFPKVTVGEYPEISSFDNSSE